MVPSIPLIAYLSAGLTGCLLVAAGVLSIKTQRSSRRELDTFAGVILGISLWWATVATIKFATTSLPVKILAYRLEMVAWVGLPVSTAMFAFLGFHYSNSRGVQPTHLVFTVLCGLLVASLLLPRSVLVATPRLVTVGQSVTLEHEFGVALGIVVGLAWAILLFSICAVLYRLACGRSVPPIIAAAAVLPLFPALVALLKLSGVFPAGGEGFNIAPIINSLAVLVFALLVYQDGLHGLVPDSQYAALENTADGYLLADDSGKIVETNHAAERLTATAIGEQVPSWLHEPSQQEPGRTTVSTPTGREVSIQRSVVRSAGTRCDVFLIHDLTEQVRRMRRLESRNLLISNLSVGVFRIELDTPPRVVYANEKLADLFDFRSEHAVRGNDVSQVFGSRQLADDDSLRSAATAPQPFEHEFSLPGGDSFWGLVSVYQSSEPEPDTLEGVVVDITAEKRAENVLAKALSETTRDLNLIEQLWKLSVSFNGFDDFADAALSVVTATSTIHSGYVVRPGQPSRPEVETVATAGELQLPTAHLSDVIQQVYRDETHHTATVTYDGESIDLIATPIVTEHVIDSVLVVASTSPVSKSLNSFVADVATALAYKRTLTHRERVGREDEFVELRIAVPNGQHPLSQLISAAAVEPTPLQFTNTRVDEQMTWFLTQADRSVSTAVTAAATAHGSCEVRSPTEADEDQWQCHVAVATANVHHRLALEDVKTVRVSADAQTTELCVHVPPAVEVSAIIDIFRAQWHASRLRSRQVVEPEPVTPQVSAELDEYQRQALEAATEMGFFARPQGATAADVAAALDTSRSTIMRRVRSGEKAVFDSLFTQSHDETGGDPDSPEVTDSEMQ